LQGSKGDKGDSGLQGNQGLKGDKGDQGNQGIKGDTGLPGLSGSTWIHGTGAPAIAIGSIRDYYLDASSGDVFNKTSTGWLKLINLRGPPGNIHAIVNAQWRFTNKRTPTITDLFTFSPTFDYDLSALPGYNINPYNGMMSVNKQRTGPVTFKLAWDKTLLVELMVDGKRAVEIGKVRSWSDTFGQNLLITAYLPMGFHSLNLNITLPTGSVLPANARVSFECDQDIITWPWISS
jgi:hypothetical protein